MTSPSPLRVLLSFPTRLGTTGIGMIAWQQVTGLLNEGAEVTVIAGSVERDLPGAARVVETMALAGRKLPYRAVGLDRATAYHDVRAAWVVRGLGAELDIVHTWPLGATRTMVAARKAGALAVVERPNSHTAYAFEAVAEGAAGSACPWTRRARTPSARTGWTARSASTASRTGCCARRSSWRARSASAASRKERLLLTQYGYDPARFEGKERPTGERPFTVIFCGRGEVRKGLHIALEAWTASPVSERGRFIICGSIDPDYQVKLEPLLAHPSVEQTGHVPDPGEYMRQSDALLLPSVEEGSALVTYEGRAAGCVLLVSDCSGAKCEHGVNALVHTARDVDQLRADMETLAGDREQLERIRTASLATLDELTWAAAGRSLIEAYRTGLARRSGGQLR